MLTSAGYVEIAGSPVWVEQRSAEGSLILLLHGGLGDSAEMLDPLGGALGERHRLLTFDRRGHGRTADAGGPFHFATMVDETIAVIEHFGIGPADIVGWSDGGIIALLLALKRADLVRKIVPIGANYHHSGVPGAAALLPLDSPFFRHMQDRYAEISPDDRAHFPSVAERVTHMWATEPTLTPDDLRNIPHPVLVMAGDRDMITLDHTASMFEALPAGQLAIVPDTTHGLIAEKPDLVARLILDFLEA